MKRFAAALLAGALALSGVLAASPAEAYPDVQVSVSSHNVIGGTDITIRASADPAVSCTWSLTYQADTGAKTVTGSGTTVSHTFHTREVDSRVTESSVAYCTYDDGSVASSSGAFSGVPSSVVSVVRTARGDGTVILRPQGDGDDDGDGDDGDGDEDDDNGGLPNTGGERLAWLIIGLLLVIAGTTVVMTSRKQQPVTS